MIGSSGVASGSSRLNSKSSCSSEQGCQGDKSPRHSGVTTLMIRNIPYSMKTDDVSQMLSELGFAGAYDLVYTPLAKAHVSSPKNLGYTFVNFTKPDIAAAFSESFHNFKIPSRSSNRLCYIKPAQCQGFQANIDMHAGKASSFGLAIFNDEGSQRPAEALCT